MELVILGRFCLLRAKIKVRVYNIVATIFHSFFQPLLSFQAQFLQHCLNLGTLPAMEIQFTFTEGCLLASFPLHLCMGPTPVSQQLTCHMGRKTRWCRKLQIRRSIQINLHQSRFSTVFAGDKQMYKQETKSECVTSLLKIDKNCFPVYCLM